MKINNLELKTLVFFVLMLASSIMALNVFSRYINIMIVALVTVQIFSPLFKALNRRIKSKGVVTFISLISVLVLLVVPSTLILILIVNEIQNVASSGLIFANISNLESTINQIIISINDLFRQYGVDLNVTQLNLSQVLSQLDKTALVRDQLIPLVRDIASLSGEILFNIFLFILALVYLFPAYEKLPESLSKVSPLDDETDRIFINRFKETIKGVVKGSLVVAILQATAVIIPLIILQVGAPVLLWIIMVILSIIPIGSGLVWGPVGIAIILNGIATGSPVTIIIGIALMIYSAIIINVIDTTVRPKLMKDTVNLHPLITIFSVLGGISLFGVLGILYGPIIMVIFLTFMEVYRSRYLNQEADIVNEN